MIHVVLGFADHLRVYEIGIETAEELQAFYDVDAAAQHIIEHGAPVPLVEVEPLLVLDTTDPTVDNMTNFLDDLATEIVDETIAF